MQRACASIGTAADQRDRVPAHWWNPASRAGSILPTGYALGVLGYAIRLSGYVIAFRREQLKRLISSLFDRVGQHSRRELAKGFLARCVSSPNGRYILGWQAANDAVMANGTAAPADGRYFLLDGGELVVEGRMARPTQGKVADTGTFVLHDQAPLAEGLRAAFYGFRRDGQTVVSRDFRAFLFSNGLSRDGRYAACQSCNSPDERDGGVLTIFDLECGAAVASWKPESGWPSGCEFDDDGQTIALLYPDAPALRYTFSGQRVDRGCSD